MEKRLSMEDKLDGKVAIITGSARGLGMAMAEGFLRTGATVAMLDRDPAGLDALTQAAAKQLRPCGVRMNALYPGDTEVRTSKTPLTTRKGRSVMVPASVFLGSDGSTEITGQSISAFRFNQEHGILGM